MFWDGVGKVRRRGWEAVACVCVVRMGARWWKEEWSVWVSKVVSVGVSLGGGVVYGRKRVKCERWLVVW